MSCVTESLGFYKVSASYAITSDRQCSKITLETTARELNLCATIEIERSMQNSGYIAKPVRIVVKNVETVGKHCNGTALEAEKSSIQSDKRPKQALLNDFKTWRHPLQL